MGTKDRLALVTGASGELGGAIAQRLASDGFYTLVHYHRNQDGALKTCQAIENQGGRARAIQFNVSDGAEVIKTLDAEMAALGDVELSVLVNNSGIHKDGLLGLMSDEAFDDVMKTNTYGPFYLMRWAVRRMMRQRSGSIVNVSSLAGQTGNPGQFNYAASKAALIAMTKSLAMEVGSRGIRVNAVAPGLIEGEMVKDIPQLADMVKRIPLGRMGRPEDVAGAVGFLCSQQAAYITGHTLSVNGGLFPT